MLDYFIYIILSERTKSSDCYERNPKKLISLNRLIQFTIKIFLKNKNNLSKDINYNKLNDSLALLLHTLIKKEFILTNLILDSEKLNKLTTRKKKYSMKT